MRAGTVTEFDDAAGLGVIAAEDGTPYAFHCIALDDGTRTVTVGQHVVFQPLARFGRFEAGAIRKL